MSTVDFFGLIFKLALRHKKNVTTSRILILAEVVRNNIFPLKEKTLKRNRCTAIGTKFTPPHSILFMTELVENILS